MLSRLARPFRNTDERGATMVEHAIVLQFFFLVLLVSMEFLRVMYNHLALQYAVSEASRRAIVQAVTTPADQIRSDIATRLTSLGIPLSSEDIVVVCPMSQLATCRASSVNYTQDYISRGRPQESVVYEIHRSINAFLFGNLQITARVFARNEPEA